MQTVSDSSQSCPKSPKPGKNAPDSSETRPFNGVNFPPKPIIMVSFTLPRDACLVRSLPYIGTGRSEMVSLTAMMLTLAGPIVGNATNRFFAY